MKMMSVTEILQTADSSCDFNYFDGSPEAWMTMIQLKAHDTGFGRLIDSILENGWEEGSAIGFSHGYINEGHHRLAASILLGLDSIPVADYGKNPGTLCAHAGPGSYSEFADLFETDESYAR